MTPATERLVRNTADTLEAYHEAGIYAHPMECHEVALLLRLLLQEEVVVPPVPIRWVVPHLGVVVS
jgi:hypothetical protein